MVRYSFSSSLKYILAIVGATLVCPLSVGRTFVKGEGVIHHDVVKASLYIQEVFR